MKYSMFSEEGNQAVANEMESFRHSVRAALSVLQWELDNVVKLKHAEVTDTAVREAWGADVVTIAAEELFMKIGFRFTSLTELLAQAYNEAAAKQAPTPGGLGAAS